MGPGDVTSREAVLRAIEEYDQIGRDAFLAKYGFDRSRKFVVVCEGRQYDSKPLLAAAHGFQHPDQGPLRAYHFSGGHPTTSRLRALGFTIEGPADTAPAVRFDRQDCDLFARYPKKVPWSADNVTPADQQRFKDIRERLKELAAWLAGETRIDVPVKPFTSLYQANGLSPSEIWCCVYPAQVPNKSYALQVAFIISARGAELCICLGAGQAQIQSAANLVKAKQALQSVQERLASVPSGVVAALEQALPDGAVYRSSWLQPPGAGEFSSLPEWLAYCATPQGPKASISVYLPPGELENLGDQAGDVLLQLADASAPLLAYCYQAREPGPGEDGPRPAAPLTSRHRHPSMPAPSRSLPRRLRTSSSWTSRCTARSRQRSAAAST